MSSSAEHLREAWDDAEQELADHKSGWPGEDSPEFEEWREEYNRLAGLARAAERAWRDGVGLGNRVDW